MRKPLLLASLVFIAFINVTAQRELSNPLIDSKKVLEKGAELSNDGKHKAAITEYLKVPESDTGYSKVLREIMVSHYKDSNFVQAEKYGNLGLKLFPNDKIEWYSLLADVYDDTKRTDLALRTYDTVIALNKLNYLPYYNKGISLFRQSRFDEATTNFQQCVMLNPFYAAGHYFLGATSLLKGNMVQAMLSFSTSLIISPESRFQQKIIGYLVTIAEVNTGATELLQKYKPGSTDNFEEVQDIVLSKMALDKKYKLKANLEDQIVRQLQVVMEKMEYNANDKGFWMQYYVPLFKTLWEKEYFEPMVFQMFSNLDIKEVKTYFKKEKRRIDAFSETALNYLNDIRATQELNFTKREKTKVRYYVNNYLINSKGAHEKNEKNQDVPVGPWEFYHPNGRIKTKGTFDNAGMRKGEWLFYFEDGTLKESSMFQNGKANGKSQVWNDNGLLFTTRKYTDDQLDGEETTYYYNGRLMSVIQYNLDKKTGVAKYYNLDGYLRNITNYANNLQEGKETSYHPNGKVESIANYVKDLPTGEYKEFFDNGKLKMSGNFTDGKKTGLWTTLFIDGKTQQVENFVNGDLHGEVITYYNNGKPEYKIAYKKGEADGKKEEFDEDGLLISEAIFERGRLKDIKFYDKKGTVISSTTSRRGSADIAFYGADGIRNSQGSYSKDGMAEGRFITYFKNGNIASDGSFKNGLQDGKKTYYYADNKLRQTGNYKNGQANGYFTDYYYNGQVSQEGWYVDDQRQGTFIEYDLKGNITSKAWYLNNRMHGTASYYTPSGYVDYNQYFDHGWLASIEQYDSSGKVIVTSPIVKGAGKFRFNLFNGKPYTEGSYQYYKLDGLYEVHNGDGSKKSVSYYRNGSQDSIYISWHPNGKIHKEGRYSYGNKNGTWKYYFYDGQLAETEEYVDGKLEGANLYYYETGELDKKYMYKEGELDGPTTYYGDNNQVMIVLYYKADELLGYSYEDKTGKLIPMIPLAKGAGAATAYYKNGTKSAYIEFSESNIHGDRILYATNGKERVVSKRVNGVEHGTRIHYYPGGKVRKEETFFFGNLHGKSKHYSEAGALISELNYYLDNFHGDCIYYVAGKSPQGYVYYNNEMQSKK